MCSLDRDLTSTSESRETVQIHKDDAKKNGTPTLTCAALATGMKCLPASKVAQANGNVLHDWHAEVLAIRGFNRWILEECLQLAQRGREAQGEWVDWTNEDAVGTGPQGNTAESQISSSPSPLPPFRLKPDVRIHMFCSQAPCGDASMELTMASQQDAAPWTTAAPSANPEDMLGRGHFDRLGVVRRKPARPDAPVTMSKSCSDKLALKQVTGLLSGISARVVQVDNCYIQTLVLPEAEVVDDAMARSFGSEGRMKPLNDWEGTKVGHKLRPFEVNKTSRQFAYSAQFGEAGGSNLSALWTPRRQEVLVNGVLQGRKQFDPRGASCVSRRGMWKLALNVALTAGIPTLGSFLQRGTYEQAKDTKSDGRKEAKQAACDRALKGWKRNERDEAWGLD